ncbi:MAG: xanthine dehydrogenase small subunit [Polaromonas sp.]|uniref:xanthine dehydrogenase small subunit n=1 Tax=Polaromonas sp. TaxID=1869339 RepID=UPI0032663961
MTVPSSANLARPIRFIRRGEVVSLGNVPPSRTLLEVLREDLACTGTKEGCGEGDCGACTVVLGEAVNGHIRYKAINSCIRLAHSVDGLALWTVEDIAPTLFTSPSAACNALPPGGALRLRPGPSTGSGQAKAGSAAPAGVGEGVKPTLHPAQEAMVQCHGSQCGFCTPGFVMSLFGMYQNHVRQGKPITRELAQHDLSGNLCRCTGYRPILDAAQAMGSLPAVVVDEADLLSKLELLALASIGLEADLAYKSPRTLSALLQARASHPQAQLVAGCTDVGLWVTKLHQQFAQVIDVTKVEELRRIEDYPHHLAIGAAVTLADAYDALVKDRPQLHNFAARFAGLPVRNSGTLGGNVANGSPIGDSMPLLIAMRAHVVLMSERDGKMRHREMPLEKLYTGYRQNVMAADEVLAWIKVPKPVPVTKNRAAPGSAAHEAASVGAEFFRVYKISKRYDDDISTVCLAINLQIENHTVVSAAIGAGGVAATPVRAVQTEAALLGQPWTQQTVKAAMATLRAEFSPISDMRASAAYRSEVLGNLLQRYWLESQGMQQINLATFRLEEPA